MPAPIKIQEKHQLSEALNFLSRVPKHESGRISWASNDLERGTFEVIYNLTFKPAVDGHVKDGAIWHVLNECAHANDFSNKFFLQRLRSYLTLHFSKQKKQFFVAAQINATAAAALPRKIPSIYGPMEFRVTLPRTIQRVIGRLGSYEREGLSLHDDFLYITCKIAATDDRSAIDVAYRTIKYALGVLNLATYGYGVEKRFGYPNAPIGRFLLASPIFVVDTSTGSLGKWQSESQYPLSWKQNFSVSHRQEAENITKNARNFLSDMSRIDFKNLLIQAVVLFQEGLESTNVDVALLKFWTGIEVLCAKDEREPTERIVERASSIFTDPRHAEMRIRYIQEFRNKIVHRGEADDHALLCAQYGSAYLAVLIRFFLWNRYRFRNREVILDYLSTPLDEEKLRRRISIARTRLGALKRAAAR
jgi:hypothetical protein